MSHPLKLIRVISEGRPGHENQSVGLAQALARRTGALVEVVRIPTSFLPGPRLRAALAFPGAPASGRRVDPLEESATRRPEAGAPGVASQIQSSSGPQLVIGAGHKVHLPLWFAAQKFKARSVVIMAPTWPKRWFDLCVLPQHDAEPGNGNPRIITTLGALNRVPEIIPTKQPQGVVLIGGPSKSHGWDGPLTASAIVTAVNSRPELTWAITDSRRTPPDFLERLRAQNLRAEIISHQQTPPDWVPTHLMAAEEAWATEDSVSMIFEAVTAGARTGVLPVPAIKPNADPVRAVEKLVQEGYATSYETWVRNGQRLPAPKPLHETGRCADLVLKKLFPGATP